MVALNIFFRLLIVVLPCAHDHMLVSLFYCPSSIGKDDTYQDHIEQVKQNFEEVLQLLFEPPLLHWL